MNELELLARAPSGETGVARVLSGPSQPDFAAFQPGTGIQMGFDDLKVIEARIFLQSVADGQTRPPGVAEIASAARVLDAIDRSCRSSAVGGRPLNIARMTAHSQSIRLVKGAEYPVKFHDTTEITSDRKGFVSMTEHHDMLSELDVDGAIQETAEAAREGLSRGDVLRRAALGGGALLGSGAIFGALPALASSKASSGDIAILNYALTLEYLEAAFYTEAVAMGKLSGETKTFAAVVKKDEVAHVQFLQSALGAKAVKKPKFNFKGTTANQAMFEKTAMALEDTGVAAYAGQGPRIADKKVLAAALSVHSVEARHAAWIRDIIGKGKARSPAPAAFDTAMSMAEVLKIVKGTGFIVTT